MLFHSALALSCLLLQRSAALPTEQQPLKSGNSHNVQTVRAELKKAEIIPTVIDDFLPSLTLSVSWSHSKAKLGNTLKPTHLQKAPKVTLHDEISSTSHMSYVITLTDPDAPSRDDPKWSEMCHWIATNLTLSSSSSSSVPCEDENIYSILPFNPDPDFGLTSHSGPDDVVEYKPPGPPEKTGKHRYVFIVFAPKNGTSETLWLSKPMERQHWGTGKERGGVREWAEENGLVSVGANFIYAENKVQ